MMQSQALPVEEWDYIIVGAGSAGCALAYRLGEDPGVKILVLEAGSSKPSLINKIPGLHKIAWDHRACNWNFVSEREAGLNGRSLALPRGKIVGGSSSINGMVYVRGHAQDYDAWADAGCTGWSYADVLPYFRRAETAWAGAGPFRGDTGPVNVAQPRSQALFFDEIAGAMTEAGYPVSEDSDGGDQEGFSPSTQNVRNGQRCSTNVAYLEPALKRGNVTLVSDARATRIVIEDRRAVAVEYDVSGMRQSAACRREIILSGGSYNSPHLLMLSGIGPTAQLQSVGIRPLLNLPGVGQNLQEHPIVNFVLSARDSYLKSLRLDRLLRNALRWSFSRTGDLAHNGLGGYAFLRTDDQATRPDIQIMTTAIRYDAQPWLLKCQPHEWTWGLSVMHPHSRGHIALKSADPLEAPAISLNLLSDHRDVDAMISAIAAARRIASQGALSNIITGEAAPGAQVQSQEDLEAFIRASAGIAHHPAGTCRMGNDPLSVVDPALRVRGINRPSRRRRLDHAEPARSQYQRCGDHDWRKGQRPYQGGTVMPELALNSAHESETDGHELDEMLARKLALLRDESNRTPYPSSATRKDRMRRAMQALVKNDSRIIEAAHADFGQRPEMVSIGGDLLFAINSLHFAIKNVDRWMKPEKRRAVFPFNFMGTRLYVFHQPVGVVGIMAPWNMPVGLSFAPLAGVLAAGNLAMIKPSELTPHSSALVAEIVKEAFSPEEVSVALGGVDVGSRFTALPFDHIIFTGSAGVARSVMHAAADRLTPLTLELGGKAPVIIAQGADLKAAAIDVMNGKLINGGQACMGVDHVFVHENDRDAFVAILKQTVADHYPDYRNNRDLIHMFLPGQRQRLANVVQDAIERGADVSFVCETDMTQLASEPNFPLTLIVEPPAESLVMRDEIFGPLLPIISYRSIEGVTERIRSGERPLGLYFLGGTPAEQSYVLQNTWAGGVSFDAAVLHPLMPNLPFGGIGQSGMGKYGGHDGFKTFSNAKAVAHRPKLNLITQSPPYTPIMVARLRKLARRLAR